MYEEPGEDGEGNLYVHHNVMLPAFPLSVAWLDCDPAGKVCRWRPWSTCVSGVKME